MRQVAVLALALAGAAACDHGIASSPEAPTVPSSPTTPATPVTPVGPFGAALVVSSPIVRAGAGAQGVVYVSLPSGTIKPSYTVSISNLRTGATVVPRLLGTGFDPVAIPAAVGDVIAVTVADPPFNPGARSLNTVAGGRPIRVVRTEPDSAADGIEVETAIRVVLSEPIDSTRVASQIRLQHEGQDVAVATSLDTSGTQVTLRPLAKLLPGTVYRVVVSAGVTGVTGASLPSGTSSAFTTVPLGDPAIVSQIAGVWQATSWRFASADDPNGGLWDDPVMGWGPNAYYTVRVAISPTTLGPAGSVAWRFDMVFHVGGASDSSGIAGTGIVGANWMFSETTQSPWLDVVRDCQFGSMCPLQFLYDFRRDADVLTLTRHAKLWYNDAINPLWRANETLTMRRVSP